MRIDAYIFKGQEDVTRLRFLHDNTRVVWLLGLGILRHVGISESVRCVSVNSVVPYGSEVIPLDIDEATPPIPSIDLLWDWVASHICPEEIPSLLIRLKDYPELLHKLVQDSVNCATQ